MRGPFQLGHIAALLAKQKGNVKSSKTQPFQVPVAILLRMQCVCECVCVYSCVMRSVDTGKKTARWPAGECDSGRLLSIRPSLVCPLRLYLPNTLSRVRMNACSFLNVSGTQRSVGIWRVPIQYLQRNENLFYPSSLQQSMGSQGWSVKLLLLKKQHWTRSTFWGPWVCHLFSAWVRRGTTTRRCHFLFLYMSDAFYPARNEKHLLLLLRRNFHKLPIWPGDMLKRNSYALQLNTALVRRLYISTLLLNLIQCEFNMTNECLHRRDR